MAAEPLLRVEGLEVSRVTRDGVGALITEASFCVGAGEIVGIVGESGVGKSLALSALLRVLNPPVQVTKGRVMYRDVNLLELSEMRLNSIRGNEIAYIGPNPHTLLNPLMQVGKQAVAFVRAHTNASKNEARERVLEMFNAVGIPAPTRRFDSYPHELSGGMAQRVVISIGLICSPSLILADEPTFGLDVTIQAQVLELVNSLVAGEDRSMLLVTRDLSIIANYCQRLYVMDHGVVVEAGSTDEFFETQQTEAGAALVRAARLVQAAEVRRRQSRRGSMSDLGAGRASGS